MSVEIFSAISNFFRQHSECFAFIGALYASYLALRAICSVWHGLKVYVLSSVLGLSTKPASFGSWAVVTGATDGIGRAYAEELAKQGLNIVLVSRSPDKLKDVASQIEKQSPSIKTKCVAVDFSTGYDIYGKVAAELQGLDIGVLVNNVGMSYDCPEFLAECSDQELRNMITVNCNSVTFMSKILLPEMMKKKKGLIINIASQSGFYPVPLLTVYSATKAFVQRFSEGLAAEYKSKGIVVQCVSPGFVATKMSKIRTSSFFAPDPTSYARSALGTIGLEANTSGCMSHCIQEFVSLVLPTWITTKAAMSLMMSARTRRLSKQSKAQ